MHYFLPSSSIRLPVSTFERKVILFLVTGAGVGYFPLLPGTIATLVAIPLSLGLNHMATSSLLLALLTLTGAISCAISLATKGVEILKQKDPAVIVIDEIVGFLVANFFAPARMGPLVLTFFLFRFFDIIKPFPISRLETLPSGRGIVLDDVMAGIYTLVILRVLLWWSLL